ncbi:MAG: HD domain-containing protein [Clostridia bacterium]|nr:HD domain-containing protein [Clostridia bacterium]
MKKRNIKNLFISGGLSFDEFMRINHLVWQRNKKILKITSLLSMFMGALFLIYAFVSKSSTWVPYLILIIGSAVIYILSRILAKSESVVISTFMCYGQLMLVCTYAGILSTQTSNYAVPATSIVVFIALLPLSIDDRLIRMYSFMITESAIYLVVSRLFKSPEAFSLDVINVVTFCVIGMVLYGFISIRNIREIYQGVRIESIQKSIIISVATVVEERDKSTGEHIARTEEYVRALTEQMKKHERYCRERNEYYEYIILAAPMHDIGKIKIPDAILNKPGRLSEAEYEIMKNHSVYGADIIEKTMKDVEEEDYYAVACNIAKYHHERFDGKGYPEGLKGEAIPLEARIMSLADVYDALVSERVYKEAYSPDEARRIIEEGRGTQFDPELMDLFLKCIP